MRGLGLFLGMRRRQRGGGGAASPPTNTVAPVVTGTGYVGYTLTTTDGTWTGSPAFTYQWQRSGVDIGGATLSTYVVTLADEGLPVWCVVTGTNGGGSASANSNAIEQWVPTDAGTVAGWFDALTPSTLTLVGIAPSQTVSQWSNRGSVSVTPVQATAANQPAYSATSWDGVRPCVTFDGANDCLLAGASDLARNTAHITVAAATRLNAITAPDRILTYTALNYDTNLARSLVHVLTGSSSLRGAGRMPDGSAFRPGADAAVTTSTRSIVAQIDGANDRSRTTVDGTLPGWTSPWGVGGVSATPDNTSSGFAIGANAVGSAAFWQGCVAEVLHFDIALSDDAVNKVSGYLAWRWNTVANLPGGHPWKTSAPTP